MRRTIVVRWAAIIAILLGGVSSNFAAIDWYVADISDTADDPCALLPVTEEHDEVITQSQRRVPQDSPSAAVGTTDKTDRATPKVMTAFASSRKHTRERAPPTQG